MSLSQKIIYSLASLLIFSQPVFAEEKAEASTKAKAILEASPENGIKLADVALKRLNIQFLAISDVGSVKIPIDAVVHSLSRVGIYRLRDGWLKLIPIKAFSDTGQRTVIVHSSELSIHDKVVVQGAALVRVAEMEAFGGGE